MAFKININGTIGGNGGGLFSDGEPSFSLKDLNTALASMPSGTAEINVEINSGGGLVTEGFAIHDKLMSLPQKVNTVVLGMCGSIATIIAQAGKKGKRSIYQNSEYFIHNPFWQPGWENGFDATQLQAITDDLVMNEEKILNFYVTTTGQSKTVLSAKMQEAKMLTAEDAKNLGFVDEVIQTVSAAMPKYKIAAYLTQNKKDSMESLAKQFMDTLNAFEAKIMTSIKGNVKNATVTSDEGTTLYYDGALAVGAKCYSDVGMTTPANDGIATISGSKYTIAGGAISKVEPVTTNKADETALKAEIETLKTDLATATEANKVATESRVEAEKKLTEFANDFKNFKSQFMTGNEFKPEFTQSFKDEDKKDAPKPGSMAAVLEARKVKAEAEKAAKEKK